jgi:hypothetical protein
MVNILLSDRCDATILRVPAPAGRRRRRRRNRSNPLGRARVRRLAQSDRDHIWGRRASRALGHGMESRVVDTSTSGSSACSVVKIGTVPAEQHACQYESIESPIDFILSVHLTTPVALTSLHLLHITSHLKCLLYSLLTVSSTIFISQIILHPLQIYINFVFDFDGHTPA